MWCPAPVQLSSIPESSALPTLQSSQRTVSHMTLSEYICSESDSARPSISSSPVTHLFHVSDTHESRIWAFHSSSIASVPQTDTRSIAKTARGRHRKSGAISGNNRYGRKGKLRCEQCRSWKQKCCYVGVESSCGHCLEKGFECGPKVSVSYWESKRQSRSVTSLSETRPSAAQVEIISRPPPTPNDQLLTSFEGMCIQSLREGESLFRFRNLQFFRQDDHRLWEYVFRRFDVNLSSKSVRYGYILYSLYKHKTWTSGNSFHLQYLNQFYQATREAISQNAFADLVYGSFVGCLYAIRVGQSFSEVEIHANGFRLSAENLMTTSTLEYEEIFLLNCMWEKLLWYIVKKSQFPLSTTPQALAYLTNHAQPLSGLGLNDQRPWIQESYCMIKVKIQFIRFVATLYCYNGQDAPDVEQSLFKRLRRDFLILPETQFDLSPSTSRFNRARLHSLSRTLWSKLLLLLFDVALGIPEPRVEGIGEIIDLIPQPGDSEGLPIELWNLIDLAVYCLVLMGLSMIESQPDELFSLTPLQNFKLTVLVPDSTRARLVTWLPSSKYDPSTFVSSFDQVCLDLLFGAQGISRIGGSQVLSKWIALCG